MKELDGQSALILGYGREGKSVHRFIRATLPEVRVGIADEERVEPEEEGARLHFGESYLGNLSDYDIVIRSPGISFFAPEIQEAIREGKKVTSGTNIFFSECPGTIVGVTGTKGKSTTSTLISHILRTTYPDTRLVGNIGKPALDHLTGASDETLFVAELSSHQLEDARYSPQIAVVLAIVPEHLSRHGSFEAYVEAKTNIVRFQKPEDTVIFNPNHAVTKNLVETSAGRKFRYSIDSSDVDCFVRDGKIFVEGDEVMSVAEIPLLGRGNLENVLAAVAVGRIMGVDLPKIRAALKEFKALPHRLEYVGEKNGIVFYNDSLATIPEATINALESLGENVETLIVGGYDRGLDFSKLGKYLAKRSGLRSLILFPTTGEKIWQAIQNQMKTTRLQKFNVDSMEEGVRIALENTSSGKICLLSPASASFGIFKDYEDRGNQFKNLANS